MLLAPFINKRFLSPSNLPHTNRLGSVDGRLLLNQGTKTDGKLQIKYL